MILMINTKAIHYWYKFVQMRLFGIWDNQNVIVCDDCGWDYLNAIICIVFIFAGTIYR